MQLIGPRMKRFAEAGLGILATVALAVAATGVALLIVWIAVLIT